MPAQKRKIHIKRGVARKIVRVKKTNVGRPSGRARSEKKIFKKSEVNPIIAPREEYAWEAHQTFNPATLFEDGKVHILYRALGHDGISRLGYANSSDGITLSERSSVPVYTAPSARRGHHHGLITYSSGGGWGGCEDPRLVRIDDRVYLTFVAFDGWGSVQMALSWIGLNDFLQQQWKWKKPVFISPIGEVHKNWVLFPEKIKGKYAILHSLSPEVLVHYVDSLDEFDRSDERTYYIKSHYAKESRHKRWDSWVRGAGPPPIKTPYGWLLLYHAMDIRDPDRYKLGAMILDEKDPTKILYRSSHPVLEPDELYENKGHKAGVIYSCGAVVMDGQLFVYYGGADTVTCVATTNLEKFLDALIHDKPAQLKNTQPRRTSQYYDTSFTL